MIGKAMIGVSALILAVLAGGTVYCENTPASVPDLLTKVQGEYDEKGGLSLINEVNEKGGISNGLYLGIIYHNLARQNPDKYLKKALTVLNEYYRKSTNALSYGYYGSAVTIEASAIYKKASIVTNKEGEIVTNRDIVGASSKVDEGCRIIDQAVTNDPGNISLRFLRLINSLNVSQSSPFKRYAIAREDCRYLFENYYKGADNYWKAQLQLLAGKTAACEGKLEEALSHFEKVLQILPGSPAALEAKKYISRYEE